MQVFLLEIGIAERTQIARFDRLFVTAHRKRVFEVEARRFLFLGQVTIHQVSHFYFKQAAGYAGHPIQVCVFNALRLVAHHGSLRIPVIGVDTCYLIVGSVPRGDQPFAEQFVFAVQLRLPQGTVLFVGVETCGITPDIAFEVGVRKAVVEHIAPCDFVLGRLPAHIGDRSGLRNEFIAFAGAVQTVVLVGAHLLVVLNVLLVAVGQRRHDAQLVSPSEVERKPHSEGVVLRRSGLEPLESVGVHLSGPLAVGDALLVAASRVPFAVVDIAEKVVAAETLVAVKILTRGVGVHARTN